MQFLITIVIVFAIIYLLAKMLVTYWYVSVPLVLIILAAIFGPRFVRHFRKNRYFASEEFQARMTEMAALVGEHNDIADYVQSIHDFGSFEIGFSSTGELAHLAVSENTSHHNYRRDRNTASFDAINVHNCSLQIVRNANQNPIKYLMKYFNIKASENTLEDVEGLGECISRLENAIRNLQERESKIATTMAPPEFILKYYHDEFMLHVGVELSPVQVPYPTYVFEYVSAGGYSSQTTTVTLDTMTIDALIEALSEKIRFRNSAAGQRALMTGKFREYIKSRDHYTCNHCSVSIFDEPHLLLEVDHIVPISRGGLSIEDNLQTLCWRCNRKKSNKLEFT